MNNLERRLTELEANRPPEDRSWIRAKMKHYLDRVAQFRREGRSLSEVPELSRVSEALRRRRGEGSP